MFAVHAPETVAETHRYRPLWRKAPMAKTERLPAGVKLTAAEARCYREILGEIGTWTAATRRLAAKLARLVAKDAPTPAEVRAALSLRRGLGLQAAMARRPESVVRDRRREAARARLEKAFSENPDELLAAPIDDAAWERLVDVELSRHNPTRSGE